MFVRFCVAQPAIDGGDNAMHRQIDPRQVDRHDDDTLSFSRLLIQWNAHVYD